MATDIIYWLKDNLPDDHHEMIKKHVKGFFLVIRPISNLSISLEQFDKTKTKLPIPLKQEELFLEVFEDEGVNRVRAEGAKDRGVAGFCGDLLQETSKDGERGWIVRLFLEDSDDWCVSCEVFAPEGAVPNLEEAAEPGYVAMAKGREVAGL